MFSHIVAVEKHENVAVQRDLCWCGGQNVDVFVSNVCSLKCLSVEYVSVCLSNVCLYDSSIQANL